MTYDEEQEIYEQEMEFTEIYDPADSWIEEEEAENTFHEPERVLSGKISELTNEQKAILAEIKDQRESEQVQGFNNFTNDLFDSLNF